MITTVNIKYPVEDTVLFSGVLTINYGFSKNTDANISGVRFSLDDVEYTDNELTGLFTITGLKEGRHLLTGYLLDKKQRKRDQTDFHVNFDSYESTIDVENKITHVIKSTIPNFVKEDYPNFILFLQAYYEWLYSSNNPFFAPLISETYKDIDKTPDFFINYFREQYLEDFPQKLAFDRETQEPMNIRNLIKNIIDFYSSKGTEKSINFLIKILFDTYSEIYLPKKDIFKPSYSEWVERNSIKFVFSAENIYKIKSRRIYQENGGIITAVANIDEIIVQRTLDNKRVVEVFYSKEEGTFDFTKVFKVDITEEEVINLTPVTVVNELTIVDGGLNYKINDKLVIKRLTHNILLLEDISFARVAEVDQFGTITKIEFISFGVSYIPVTYDTDGNLIPADNFLYFVVPESEDGTGAEFDVGTGYISDYSGFWLNKNSHPDTVKKLHDNKRYQDFSYVVRTDRMLDRYSAVLKKLAHPAGMELLGDILIKETIIDPVELVKGFVEVYTPLIGNYIPYRIQTATNLRGILDLFPNGFDPESIIPPQDGSDDSGDVHSIGSDGPIDDLVDVTRFGYIPDVPDKDHINDYWVVYPHPNTEINTTGSTDTDLFMNIRIRDFVKQEKVKEA